MLLFVTRKGKLNVPLLYLHRYLRLTPILAVSMLFNVTLMRFLGDGPIWSGVFQFMGRSCEHNWWLNFLYIQNYIHTEEIVSYIEYLKTMT